MLDLPAGIPARLFDRDGVLTRTARVHARAWKQMSGEFDGSVRLAEAARDQGLRRAVVSSSTNRHDEHLFEERKGADVVVDDLSELLGT